MHSAEVLAADNVSSSVPKAQPTGPTLIALPLPQLLYGDAYPLRSMAHSQSRNIPPYPAEGYALPQSA